MELVYKRCNNCGRECHCGIAQWETVVVNGEETVEIKICDHCVCSKEKENNERF